MDNLATQVYEDDDFTPTQQVSYPMNQDNTLTVQIGVLNIGPNIYPIKKGINKIGRHPDCDVVLNNQTVSKNHAEIEANSRDASAWICDLNSSNKTRLNNSVLRSGRCYELKDGSNLQFGMVRAVFKVCSSTDDALVTDTPLPSRQKNQVIIPGTPDSSAEMSNTSTLGDNVSMIPGTQNDDREPTFRRPSVPQRNSTSSKKKSLPCDSSIDESLTVGDKENVGKQKVSIHDMETQKPYESQNETVVDIHDVETQKICLSGIRIPMTPDQDIHDMETQHEEDNNTGTGETDVQYDVGIHDAETPKRIYTRHADDNVADENLETTLNTELPRIRVREDISCLNISDEDGSTDDAKDVQKNSEEDLQLSPATNFEEDCSELDISRNLLGSQNLLEHIIEHEELTGQTESKLTSVNSTDADDVDEVNDKSTDDENIFDAATQVNIHDTCEGMSRSNDFKGFERTDDSATTNQGVFQNYSRVGSKDNDKSLQDKASNDSDTDEEGHFVKIALEEKQKVSSFSEKRRSDANEIKSNHGSSKDSEDMFDMLTQHVNVTNKNTLIKKSDDDEDNVDFDAPTQIIIHQTEKPETEAETKAETKDIDLAPTQILIESPVKEVSSVGLSTSTETVVDDDITEMEDNVATQIITPPDNVADNNRDKSPSPSNTNPTEEDPYPTVEDLDYEMAPTQLINEVDRKKPTRKSNVSNKISLNDTLEKNLNAMFGGVNEDSLEDQQEISTQILRNVLQSSQSNDESQNKHSKSDIDSKPLTNNNVKNSIRQSKSEVNSLTGRKIQISNLSDKNTDSESQSTENYFAVLSSARKNNVLTDSEDLVDSNEGTSNDKIEKKPADESESVDNMKDSTCNRSSVYNSKNTTTPRSTRSKYKNTKVVEEIASSEDVEDVTNDTEQGQSTGSSPKSPSVAKSRRKRKQRKIKDSEEISVAENTEDVTNDTEQVQPTESNPTSPPSPILTSKHEQEEVNDFEEITVTKNVKDVTSGTEAHPTEFNPVSPSSPILTSKDGQEEIKDSEEMTVAETTEDVTNNTEQSEPSKFNSDSPSAPSSPKISESEEPKVIVEQMPVLEGIIDDNLEANTSNETEDVRHSFKTLYNDDEDIMAGLPEVRISGTLSNPPSPPLSPPVDRRTNTRTKKKPKNAASKNKRAAPKTNRKTKNTENSAPYQSIRKSGAFSGLKSTSKVFSNTDVAMLSSEIDEEVNKNSKQSKVFSNTDVAMLSSEIDEEVNKNSKRSTRNTTVGSSQISKENDFPHDGESTLSTNTVQESSVQSDGRTRTSTRKNVDRSSIFQVQKEAPVENVTEPVKPSRIGKRSLSTTEMNESNVLKKPREDVANIRKSARNVTSNARNSPITRHYSANIVNMDTNKNSPINMKDTGNSKLSLDQSNKQVVINITRISPQNIRDSMSPSSPMESVAKNIVNDAKNVTQVDATSKTRKRKGVSNIEPQQVRSQRANSRCKAVIEDDSSQGEESQEVEKIMSGFIMEESVNETPQIMETADTNKKGIKTRNTTKRARTNTPAEKDIDESSIPPDLSESNDAHFEVPTSKSKRAKISRSSSIAPGIPTTETPIRTTRTGRQSKSSQIQPRIIPDSSPEDRSENSANQSNLDNTTIKRNIPKKKGAKSKMEKLEVEKKENKLVRNSSVSSEMDTSIDNASIASTPNRTRRSTSSMSSPFKTKHKILFTGIESNDYAKLIKKLGASEVANPTNCTVLVTDKVRRTFKFLCALAQAIPIVSIEWLIESEKAKCFVDMKNYILKDPAAEAKFGFKLRGSLEKAREQKLLEGYSIILTPNVAPPPIAELKNMIVSCGGKALIRSPSTWPQKAVIISREEDLTNAKKFAAKAPKTVTIQSTEFILTGILRQKLDFVNYKLT